MFIENYNKLQLIKNEFKYSVTKCLKKFEIHIRPV